MKVPVSWLKDFVEITLPIEELAHELTMAGLEVEEIKYVGLPLPNGEIEGRPGGHNQLETKVSGLEWDPEKIVVAEIREVMPHPNADRLVLCRLYDGQQEQTVLTGAPNLFEYKGQGPLEEPLKVAYAKEGSQIYDGHQPGFVLTTLKRAKIRGVESYSMVCSEKELGISDEHEGIIILDPDAPSGMPLVDYMGDAVLDIAITPNIARDANILGVAREVSALTGAPLRSPENELRADGPSIEGKAFIEIRDPELNPRFVLGLIQGIEIKESPYWVQRRLRLAGMRPISNIVDATNYAMLELGEPLHAFDYDVLLERAGGSAPTIITRTAKPGEQLTTLDDIDRQLDDFTVLVTDTAGPLSIAGVMGGLESEISSKTRNILLEGAAWNFINIRRTVFAQRLHSEAAYRFSRGVHPAMAERGVRRGLALMHSWAGGTVAQGLVDNYPLPPIDPTVSVTPAEVTRWLGIELNAGQIADILRRLQFEVQVDGELVSATTPPHRLDIGEGITGAADLIEEIARIYGYERIPTTRMSDELPEQRTNELFENEESLRDLLVDTGLQEVISYRMTTPEREARRLIPGTEQDLRSYVRLANPISSDRTVLRQSLLASLLEIAERNARLQDRIALFETGPVFIASPVGDLPEELSKLAILLTGRRALPSWQGSDTGLMDFYDLKGVIETMLRSLRIGKVRYQPAEHPTFHPGKTAEIVLLDENSGNIATLGVMGELHPLVHERYELPDQPVLAGEFDLQMILKHMTERFAVKPVPAFPPVLEDLAVVVDRAVPAEKVAEIIQQAGGKTVSEVKLFDVYQGEQVAPGKKSLAYSLTYQEPERTLTDEEVSRIRLRIIHRLEQDLNAVLRS